jgi:hypothetical protein
MIPSVFVHSVRKNKLHKVSFLMLAGRKYDELIYKPNAGKENLERDGEESNANCKYFGRFYCFCSLFIEEALESSYGAGAFMRRSSTCFCDFLCFFLLKTSRENLESSLKCKQFHINDSIFPSSHITFG